MKKNKEVLVQKAYDLLAEKRKNLFFIGKN